MTGECRRRLRLPWMANVGRLLYNYPCSYSDQRLTKFLILIPNMVLTTLALLCLYPTWVAWRVVPFELRVLLLVAAVAFALSSMVSAYNRQFTPIVPILAVWICYVGSRLVRVEMAPAESG